MHISCITFEDPQGSNDYVGINWGDAPLGFTGLQGYSDQHCKNAVGNQILLDNENNTDWRGPNTCVSIADYGGPWGSVEGLGVYLADSGWMVDPLSQNTLLFVHNIASVDRFESPADKRVG